MTLMNAWQNTLETMTEFVFSLPEKNCVADYLHVAVFDFKKNMLKTVKNSIHANEYFNCPVDKQNELKQSANEKVQQGIEIIKKLVSAPGKCITEKTQNGVFLWIHNFKNFFNYVIYFDAFLFH